MRFKHYITFSFLLLPALYVKAQQTYPLSLHELFDRGTENSLRIKASHIQEIVAGEKEQHARNFRLPEIKLSATTGYVGQPTVFRSGLAHPTHPDVPDWSHNYNVE